MHIWRKPLRKHKQNTISLHTSHIHLVQLCSSCFHLSSLPLCTIYVCARDAAVWRCARVMTAGDAIDRRYVSTLHADLFDLFAGACASHSPYATRTHTRPAFTPRPRTHTHTSRRPPSVYTWRRGFSLHPFSPVSLCCRPRLCLFPVFIFLPFHSLLYVCVLVMRRSGGVLV